MLPHTRCEMFSRSALPQPKGLIGSKDSAMKESQITGVLTPILAQFGLELEALEIIPAGKRRVLRRRVRRRQLHSTERTLPELRRTHSR